ncbi:hypothetical protein [Legionella sp. km772]|uniref:hypothetical protein n=1 Tax=Legionella sp. km772 TaxID=2498111 RepID=UPI000F8F61ED|nr:hypothetical protein [Legionella sp. km772]RUR09981.1 hypothetical protein ELY15_08635 [Legionella sp. km772]
MVPSKKTDHIPLAAKCETIHRHLQIQFEGLTSKFSQEIDEIIQVKEELRDDLERLKLQLNAACEQFGQAPQKGSLMAIEQFCKNSNLAIDCYKKAPKGYIALARNGIARETMDNIVARFTSSINSAITYTKEYNDLSSTTSELSTTLHLLESIKAKFVSAKIQFTSTQGTPEEAQDSTKPGSSKP